MCECVCEGGGERAKGLTCICYIQLNNSVDVNSSGVEYQPSTLPCSVSEQWQPVAGEMFPGGWKNGLKG